MRAEEVREDGMRGELVSLVLGAQAGEVGVVAVLKHMGCQNSRHKHSGCQKRWETIKSLDPNGNIDSQVEQESKNPMGEPHSALARRGIGVRLEQTAYTLQQHKGPHKLHLAAGLPYAQPPCPEQRAGDRDDVEVGEVVVRDLDGRGTIE